MIYLKSNEFFMNSHSSVTTELRAPQEPYPEHAHNFEELIIVAHGSGTHVMNDVPMNISKNYVCFVARQDRHLFDHVDNLFLSNVLFERDKLPLSAELQKFIPKSDDDQHGWFISEETAHRANQIIQRLDVESHIDSDESQIIAQALFQQLIVELWRGKVTEISTLSHDDKICYALAKIQRGYSQLHDIDALAEEVKLSPRQLTNSIKKYTGMSFNQYLHYTRACRALSAILYTEQSITDIAFDVGYQDSNYFSTKFKQVFHTTPRDARLRGEMQTALR